MVVVVVVVCFHDLRFCLSSQLKAASYARCSSEMPLSKQVNGHSLTMPHGLMSTAVTERRGDVTPLLHAVLAMAMCASL